MNSVLNLENSNYKTSVISTHQKFFGRLVEMTFWVSAS